MAGDSFFAPQASCPGTSLSFRLPGRSPSETGELASFPGEELA